MDKLLMQCIQACSFTLHSLLLWSIKFAELDVLEGLKLPPALTLC